MATRTLSDYISVDRDRLGGEPVFKGTRVPVRSLFDHIKAGDTLDAFLDDFPGVSRDHARAVIELAENDLLQRAGAAA